MKYPSLHSLLESSSIDLDVARREFILNVLLLGLSIMSFVGLLAAMVNLIDGRFVNGKSSVLVVGLFFALIIILWRLSKLGHRALVNYSLLSLVGMLAVWLMFVWSFELAVGELCFALLLVLSGVLLSSRSALRFSISALILYLIGAYLQESGWFHPNTNWLNQSLLFGDAVGYAIIFSIIILVSWLANREIDRSLLRARKSEAALERERDSLEIKVIKRTRQLEETQTNRILELQRFAEFGRLSANLLHEVANPLTAASLNLERLEAESHSKLSIQIRENVQRIEQYVSAARKQLSGQGEVFEFNVKKEVESIVRSLNVNSEKQHVDKIVGDVVKFNQLIRNLLSNALESYAQIKTPRKGQSVQVNVTHKNKSLTFDVRDFGIGIKQESIAKIFDPFYSTKKSSKHNLGIGLSMVKQFAEDDFGGSIKVTSTETAGTSFKVILQQNYKK